jgi:D-aminopeptidase
MLCLGFKGGIGSASRRLPSGHTLGVLVLANFGRRDRLTVDGVPVGRLLDPAVPGLVEAAAPVAGPTGTPQDRGSCIALVVTDAPLDGAACERVARRAPLGLARVGSTASHGSGELVLAAATGLRGDRSGRTHGVSWQGYDLEDCFTATVDATEAAVLAALVHATTTQGRRGRVAHALPPAELSALLAVHRPGR